MAVKEKLDGVVKKVRVRKPPRNKIVVKVETEKGGCVYLNKKHGAWASYCVASAGGMPPPELFYSGVTLDDGKKIQVFINRELGLVVVDVVDKGAKHGYEVTRYKVR